ncbi:hypothetical protein C8F01DRAFT_1111089 [Mycena amicta]|nr:hypothetical protein C8F01DRAFT_1111089 [Mycena amicta]
MSSENERESAVLVLGAYLCDSASTPVDLKDICIDEANADSLSHGHTAPSALDYPAIRPGKNELDDDDNEAILIHIEGPDSLSSSALTAGSSTIAPDPDDTHGTSTPADDSSSDAEGAEADTSNNTRPNRVRVRFRSRVRITSGLHSHHKQQRKFSAGESVSSLASSLSVSSSVSAPLRSPPTAETCTPGWGTLGTRVGLLAQSKMVLGRDRGRRKAGAGVGVGERSALLADGYDGEAEEREYEADEQDFDDEALLSRHIDLVFGRWPWRLFNRQWWWWQLQPIICCGCLDEARMIDCYRA